VTVNLKLAFLYIGVAIEMCVVWGTTFVGLFDRKGAAKLSERYANFTIVLL